ncbi:MAG: UDP-N-acetylmuramoyl-L-alanyl-D-glutamate--2,6-diaminopimelate ligase [Gammaproteobacteria bacterium]|nr:UDP-N-acetylmuramoyl-L-alanyl-D-glutamate--2,6-diaminopimelate ligase [Gammaproteobacteria bacterium]
MSAAPAPAAVGLRRLLAGLGGGPGRAAATGVTHLSCDSREIGRGGLFLAMPGLRDDGRRHIRAAQQAGAAAVVRDGGPLVDGEGRGGGVISVPGLRRKAGIIADRFYAHPSRKMRLLAVTGTNGKSTCTHLAAAALSLLGRRCGLIGTFGAGLAGGELRPLPLTTPDAVRVRAELARLAAAGARAVVLEASSHGLAQHRLDHLRIHTAVFTNLSRDHLDYHADADAYAAAKARLFAFPGLHNALVNAADPRAPQMVAQCAAATRVLAFGEGGDIHAQKVDLLPRGLRIRAATPWGALAFTSRLLGRLNVDNLLAVAGMLGAVGCAADDIAGVMPKLPPPPGRMEAFGGEGGRPLVVVDYAHTPAALEKALQSLREHTAGELYCVFGCGGERDRGKRPLMGAVAARCADRVLITDDNPRGEDPAAIINAITAGLGGAKAAVATPRPAAVTEAVTRAGAGDTVLIAGKGHETVQHTAAGEVAMSDRALAAQLVA